MALSVRVCTVGLLLATAATVLTSAVSLHTKSWGVLSETDIGPQTKPCDAPETSKGTLISLTLTDCTQLPCVCKKGGNYVMNVTFIPALSHENLRLVATTKSFFGITLTPFDQIADAPTPCTAGQIISAIFTLHVDSITPSGTYDIKTVISGVDGAIELCGWSTMTITD